MKRILFFAIAFVAITTGVSFSQSSLGEVQSLLPYTLHEKTTAKSINKVGVQKPDMEAIAAEDALEVFSDKNPRVGVNIPLNKGTLNTGNWELLSNGDRIWRMTVQAPDAEGIVLQYNNFHLAPGAKLYLIDEKKSGFYGPFDHTMQNFENIFTTQMTYGDEVTVELYEPANVAGQSHLNISEIGYIYRNSGNPDLEKDFGGSDPCQVNVACSPEGDNWVDEENGVVRILLKEGSQWGWCTGSVVNNTAQDCTPYVLSAMHCGENSSAADMAQWIFYFNYQSSGCSNPGSEAGLNGETITGCVRRADSGDGGGNSGSDFLLVELGNGTNGATIANTLKNSYGVYYNGWDANNSASTSGVSIHHPAGDIKKISTYTTTLSSTTWGGTSGTHWLVYWAGTTNGYGVTEGGSSGSPIFRGSTGLIVGTLTGGGSYCTQTGSPDRYGKMSYHWGSNPGQNLSDFLDPGNTGAMTLLGSYDPCGVTAPPATDFVADQTTVLEGATVNFTDLTTGVPTSWSWSISPGTNGAEWTFVGATTDQNPSVVFNTAGTYTVSLTATNTDGFDTETKVDYITVNPIVCSDPVTSTYTMGFESGEDLSQWVTIDANGDGNAWGIVDVSGAPQGAISGTNAAWYNWNNDGVTGGNDWLMTNCFDLTACTDYTMTFYWSTGDGYNESTELFIGNDQTVGAMTTSLINLNNVSNNAWTQETVSFTVPTDGVYYFGFHNTSAADQWYFALEDINITGAALVEEITIDSAPANITIECNESTDPSNTGQLSASTTCCDNGLNVSFDDATSAGGCANASVITRTWTITDACGNSETHVQTITVEDNTAPIISNVPSGITVQCIDEVPAMVALNWTDNCDGSGTVMGADVSNGLSCPETITRTWTQTDACGNTTSVSQEIIVDITTSPVVPSNASSTVECLSAAVEPVAPVVMDACGNNIVPVVTENNDPVCEGDKIYTFTYTDCSDNVSVYTYTYTIDVVTPPVVPQNGTETVECLDQAVQPTAPSVTDVCGNNISPVFTEGADPACGGDKVYTYTYTDCSGLSSVWTYTYTISDNTDPSINCTVTSETIYLSDGPANASDYTATTNGNDNCSSVTITQNPAPGTELITGQNTITMTAMDDCGNTTTCDVIVTVEDNLSIAEDEIDQVSIYPNPTSGILTVNVSSLDLNSLSIEIVDITGKVIETKSSLTNGNVSFDMTSYANGVYQVRVSSSDKMIVKRITKL